MTCTRPDLQEHLPELASNALEGDAVAAVQAHVNECEACQGLLADIHWTRAGVLRRAQEVSHKHLEPDLLLGYADCDSSLAESDRQAAEEHLAFCTECQAEVDLITDLNRTLILDPSTRTTVEPDRTLLERVTVWLGRPQVAWGLAALVLLMGYPTLRYLGERTPSESGFRADHVFMLQEQTRGADDAVLLHRAQRGAPLTVGLTVRPSAVDRSYSAQLLGEANVVVEESAVPPDAVRSGYVQLTLPSSQLTDGRYRIELVGVSTLNPSDVSRKAYPVIIRTGNGR